MTTAKPRHTIVLGVNIDSPKRNQVKIGKTIRPADEPINLAVQAEPVWSTISFQEYQKAMEQGTPSKNAAQMGLFFHHSDVY